ncbi:MAG: hypothetical protein AAGG48_30500 [Planctomycetota bacterium]
MDSRLAGKQVRCPKCEKLTRVPASTGQAASAIHPASDTDQPKQTRAEPVKAQPMNLACPGCGIRLSVKRLKTPGMATCPKCQASVPIPASRHVTSTGKTTQPVSQVSPSLQDASLVSPTIREDEACDLGQLEIGPIASPADSFRHSSTPPKQTRRPANVILTWINHHRWITLILGLNMIPPLLAFKFPPALVLSLFNLPVGLVIIGLLFVPRQHLVKRCGGALKGMMDGFGSQVARVGAGGIGLIVLAVCAKALPRVFHRAGNNPNLNFDMSGALPALLGVAGTLLAFVVIIAIGITLWRVMGIARVLAAGYCLQLTAFSFLLTIGVIANDNSWASFASNERNAPTLNASPDSFTTMDPYTARDRWRQRRETNRHSESRQQPIDVEASASTEAQMAARIDLFRERNTAEKTVVLRILRSNPNDSPREVRSALQSTLRLRQHFFGVFDDQCLLLFAYDGPVTEIVDQLTNGKVVRSDADKRTIEFHMDPL